MSFAGWERPMRCRSWPVLVLLAGCGLEVPRSLVDHELWQEASAQEDPFDDRLDIPLCAPTSWGLELEDGEVFLEVDTTFCDYITLWQPSASRVLAGERIQVMASHGELEADEPAEGHIAVRLGDLTLMDRFEPIPGMEDVFSAEVVVDDDIAGGEPVWFHLHNHGANTWRLIDVRVVADAAESEDGS